VERLGRVAKTWRAAVVLALTILFCAGSLVGDDHWWPFGPWRMFSTSQAATGSVWSTGIEVQTADAPGEWVRAPLTPENVGLNPARLGTLARSHAELRPASSEWTALRVVRRLIVVVDRKPTGEVRTEVLAQWEAP
jgi:hypothetical protein